MTQETDPFDEIFAFDGDGMPPETDPEPVNDVDPEPEPSPEPIPDPEPEPTTDPEPQPEPEPDYKALFEREQQRFRSFEGRYRKEKELWEQGAQAPKAPDPEPPKAPDPEDEFLQKFTETYNDDVVKAVRIISAREAQRIASELRSQAIEPLQSTLVETARDAHFRTISSAHQDWQNVVGSEQFANWVESQPSVIRRAYQGVLQQGTAPEVVEMLDAYRSSRAAPPPAPPPKVDATRAKAASAVKTSHGTMPKQRVAADDFDAAWAEFD